MLGAPRSEPPSPGLVLVPGSALSDAPFSRRYAIPPEHGKRLERLAIGRCLGWRAGQGEGLGLPGTRCCPASVSVCVVCARVEPSALSSDSSPL